MSTEEKTEASTAVTKAKPVTTAKELAKFLNDHIGTIKAVAAKVINPERMVRIVIASATKSPLLVKCDPLTILRSCAKAAELGLEVEGGLGEGYLVPYWNSKRSTYEAQFIPGYRGLIKLARRSGEISKIEAHAVYTKDGFEFEHGTEERLVHRPALDDRGELEAFYAIAVLKDGTKQFEVMSKAQVDAIRNRSKAKDDGPWKTDYDEMGRKTTVRRLAKYLPMSVTLAEALELQAKAESAEFEIDHDAVARTVRQPIAAEGGGQAEDPGADPQAGGGGNKSGTGSGQAAGAKDDGKPISATNLKTIRSHLTTKQIPESEFCYAFGIQKAEDLPAAKAGEASKWIIDYKTD